MNNSTTESTQTRQIIPVKYDVDPSVWENRERLTDPASLKRLQDFDYALMDLGYYPAYRRREQNLNYFFVIDEEYNRALSLPVATFMEAQIVLERVLVDKPGAHIVENEIYR